MTFGLYYFLLGLDPVYKATSTVFIIQNTPTQSLDSSVISVSQQLAETFTKIVKTDSLLREVENEINLGEIDSDNIVARYLPKTQLIEISTLDVSKEKAVSVTNAIVAKLQEKVNEVQANISPNSRATVETVEPAVIDEKPVFPNIPQLLIFGALLSFILALLIVALAEMMDTAIGSELELSQIFPSIPVIGDIPFTKSLTDDGFVESLRELRTNISFLDLDNPRKVFSITSPNQKEGKTYLVSEIGKILAKADKKVLLVDADFRKHELTSKAKLSAEKGLAEAIADEEVPSFDGLQSYGELQNLKILPVGNAPKNVLEILASKKAQNLFSKLKDNKDFDIILIDTPAINVVSDASSLAIYSDAVLALVEIDRTTVKQLKRFLETLGKINIKVLGFILNKSKKHKGDYYYYGKY